MGIRVYHFKWKFPLEISTTQGYLYHMSGELNQKKSEFYH